MLTGQKLEENCWSDEGYFTQRNDHEPPGVNTHTHTHTHHWDQAVNYLSVGYMCACLHTPHSHWTSRNRNPWLTKHTNALKPTHPVTQPQQPSLFFPISSPSSFILRNFSRQRFFSADPLKHRDSPWAHTQTHASTNTFLTQSLSLTHTHTI